MVQQEILIQSFFIAADRGRQHLLRQRKERSRPGQQANGTEDQKCKCHLNFIHVYNVISVNTCVASIAYIN